MCKIICETSIIFMEDEIFSIVDRILGHQIRVEYMQVPQDKYLANNQNSEIVEDAREYIKEIGGFEKFAEWGLY